MEATGAAGSRTQQNRCGVFLAPPVAFVLHWIDWAQFAVSRKKRCRLRNNEKGRHDAGLSIRVMT
jgi:hypothetical protein